jgi:hypothetical protein
MQLSGELHDCTAVPPSGIASDKNRTRITGSSDPWRSHHTGCVILNGGDLAYGQAIWPESYAAVATQMYCVCGKEMAIWGREFLGSGQYLLGCDAV